jgi:hypothetical protein
MLTINGKDFNAATAGQLLLAKHAYERYGAVTDNLNFMGKPMPTWEELPALIHLAWTAAACPDYAAKVSETVPATSTVQRDVAISRIQSVLDTPGYDPEAMEEAEKGAARFSCDAKMRQDISAYYHTHNGTNGKSFDYNWD